MSISVVIPNYNGASLLPKTLPKVISACKGMEIIVVDDASTDNSVAVIREKFPDVKLLCRPKNGGFSCAVNDGVREATGEFVLLLNSDAYPLPGFLDHLLPHFSDASLFAVGLLQQSIEDGQTVRRGRGIGDFRRGLLVHANGTDSPLEATTTLWVSGGAGIFRRSVWEKLGGMCELYSPFYWEDIDLSYRAMKSGYRIAFEPGSMVVHEQSVGSIRSAYSSSWITATAYRNQLFFVWINISDFSYLGQHLLFLPYHVIRSLVAGDWPFLRGYFQAKLNFFSALKYRQRYKHLWARTDRDVLRSVTS